MSRGRGLHETVFDRLARLQDMAKLRFHANGNIWKHVADFPTEVFLHREPVDPGKPLVYTKEAQFLVEVTKADWRVPECMLQVM